MKKSFALITAISGCTPAYSGGLEEFATPGGDIFYCTGYAQEDCGMHLSGCGDQATVDMRCVEGVFYVGPAAE